MTPVLPCRLLDRLLAHSTVECEACEGLVSARRNRGLQLLEHDQRRQGTEHRICLNVQFAQAIFFEEGRHFAVSKAPLLECEVWNRINARRLQQSHGDAVRGLIDYSQQA
jgi:hypothetical protein